MFSTMFLRNSVKRMFPKVSMMSQWRRFACTVTENPWGYKEDRWKVPILFESRREIAPDTYILRFSTHFSSFSLKNPRKLRVRRPQPMPWHEIGTEYQITVNFLCFSRFSMVFLGFSIDLGEDNEISRFYTPISPVDQQGVVEFVLKEIKDINTLSMSQMLSKLNVKNLVFLNKSSKDWT